MFNQDLHDSCKHLLVSTACPLLCAGLYYVLWQDFARLISTFQIGIRRQPPAQPIFRFLEINQETITLRCL